MKRFFGIAAALLLAACMIQAAGAAAINYDLKYIEESNRWQYDYTIENDDPDLTIGWFYLEFDFGKYENLNPAVEPGTWDEWYVDELGGFGMWRDAWLVTWTQSYILYGIEYSGLLTLADWEILPNEILNGLSISFDWNTAYGSTPGSQYFAIFDSDDNFLGDGYTSAGGTPVGPEPPPVVPEPGTLVLFGTGIAGLVAYYRRNRKR